MKTFEKNVDNNFNIDANISDIILTPFAAASIINEIIKGLLYQKCQMPYPYNWLKSMVVRKRQKIEADNEVQRNFKVENHFRLVSKFFDTLEGALSSITEEFKNSNRNIRKVVMILGTTPHTANEVFTISVSSVKEGHIERNHHTQLNKYQQKILRSIFLSQKWLDKIDATVCCTNVYIYLVKNESNSNGSVSNDSHSGFLPTEPLYFSDKIKHVNISLYSEMELDPNCCENLVVFEEDSQLTYRAKTVINNEFVENITWFKYKDVAKGFKDCFINKKSVSELW